MKLSLRLFGAFRKYEQGPTLELEVPEPCSLADLRSALKAELGRTRADFNESVLVDESAFAEGHRILQPEDQLRTPATIAVLPPVCGG